MGLIKRILDQRNQDGIPTLLPSVIANASYECVLGCTLNGECRVEYTASRPTQQATTDTLAAILLSAKKPLCINDRPLLTDLVHLATHRAGLLVTFHAYYSFAFLSFVIFVILQRSILFDRTLRNHRR